MMGRVIILIKLMKAATINNPEKSASVASHALYNNHKQARKQIQSQREQAQHTLSFLERQAKKTAKELENKQKSLISYYKLKESRFIDAQNKQSLRRKRESQLQKLRKTNSEMREQSLKNRNTVRSNLKTSNKRSADNIKHSRISFEKRIHQEKQLERQLLKKRNSAFSRALELGTQHSKAKARVQKRSQSSTVKNDLIYVQQSIKNRQIQKITTLTNKQKELLGIVEKNKKQKQYYDNTMNQFQTIPFNQIYPVIKNENRVSNSRRSSLRSESMIV